MITRTRKKYKNKKLYIILNLILYIILNLILLKFYTPSALAANNYGGTCGDGVSWNMGDDGLLTISGKGEISDFVNARSAPWYANGHILNIERIQVNYGVTGIGANAFTGCKNLTGVYLPSSVLKIGNSAFAGCESLTDITLEEGLRSIGNHAFSECVLLYNIKLPDSLSQIGQAAFSRCESLEKIALGNRITKIEPYFCKGCYNLSQVDLPNNLTSIGQEAFADCEALKNLYLPRRVSDIGPGAFAGCAYLEEIDIPASVTEIREGVFRNSGLEKIYLPNGLNSIAARAFESCYNLQEIYYAANRTRWNQIRMDDLRQQISSMGIRVIFADDSAAESPAVIEKITFDGWRVSIEISGEPGTGTTLFAAFYQADGRFLGLRVQEADEARTYSVAEIAGAGRVKAVLLDPDGRPMAKAKEQSA